MKRVIGKNFDVEHRFGFEDGKHYVGVRQDHAGIKRHLDYMRHKVQEAPTRTNPNGWGWRGSIPTGLLVEWLWKTKTPMDVWARNEGGAKDKFIAWMRREHPHLMPKPGVSARPTIVVPTTYRKRRDG